MFVYVYRICIFCFFEDMLLEQVCGETPESAVVVKPPTTVALATIDKSVQKTGSASSAMQIIDSVVVQGPQGPGNSSGSAGSGDQGYLTNGKYPELDPVKKAFLSSMKSMVQIMVSAPDLPSRKRAKIALDHLTKAVEHHYDAVAVEVDDGASSA